MTCVNGSTELSWLAGWFGRGPELLLRYHVRVARVPVVHWARVVTWATHSLPS